MISPTTMIYATATQNSPETVCEPGSARTCWGPHSASASVLLAGFVGGDPGTGMRHKGNGGRNGEGRE